MTQLSELPFPGYEAARMTSVLTMPFELMHPVQQKIK